MAHAFLSVAHAFLQAVLRHVGLPSSAMNVIRALYHNSRCMLMVRGQVFEGFPLNAGIRQGCPLSPLLFATAADLLLRALSLLEPDALVRAFADDTAMIVKDWWGQGKGIFNLFSEFGAISGLHLNLPKTVLIPLWESLPADIKAEVANKWPEMQALEVSDWSRYLGFAIGPGRGTHSWSKSCAKVTDRAKTWCWSDLGLQYSVA